MSAQLGHMVTNLRDHFAASNAAFEHEQQALEYDRDQADARDRIRLLDVRAAAQGQSLGRLPRELQDATAHEGGRREELPRLSHHANLGAQALSGQITLQSSTVEAMTRERRDSDNMVAQASARVAEIDRASMGRATQQSPTSSRRMLRSRS